LFLSQIQNENKNDKLKNSGFLQKTFGGISLKTYLCSMLCPDGDSG